MATIGGFVPGPIVIRGLGGRGNWLNTVERIKGELFRSRNEEVDQIQLAMITAIEFYRWHRFWFNEGSMTMFTETDRAEYVKDTSPLVGGGYPRELLEIDEAYVYQNAVAPPIVFGSPDTGSIGVAANFDPGRATRMRRTHFRDLRNWVDGNTGTGRPFWYAWHHERLMVAPVPSDTYVIRFDGLMDLGFPKAQYNGGDWEFRDRIKGAPILDGYNTPWLEHAEELIRNRAKADIFANVLKQPDMASLARGQEREAYRNLARATDKRKSTGRIKAHYTPANEGVPRYF